MMTMNTGILTKLGTHLLMRDTMMFEPSSTNSTPMLMPMALSTDVLTASAG